jgi:predicted TIM-barrel fold metal-dependent hydrolase
LVIDRRTFLHLTAAAAAAQPAPIPIVDTHIHLFDPTRPQGVPWPAKDNTVLYHPALPDRYRALTAGLNIRGAIEVEASPWLEDNQWVLDLAAKDKIILGTVGNLDPAHPDFARHLERFHRNPRFLGIRYGNLWDRDLASAIAKPAFVDNLKRVAQAGLVLDTANPDPALIHAVVAVTDRIPTLRVVVDHLPQMDPALARVDLRALAARPQVYVKISQVLRRVDGRVPTDLVFYRDRLDELLSLFGEDRVLYGSDWPNSDQWAPSRTVLNLVHEYFTDKGPVIAEKYFHRNSLTAYRWT